MKADIYHSTLYSIYQTKYGIKPVMQLCDRYEIEGLSCNTRYKYMQTVSLGSYDLLV